MGHRLESFVYWRPIRRIVRWLGRGRADRIAAWLRGVIPDGASVLDLGAGLGQVGHALRQAGHSVVTADRRWRCLDPGAHVLADGAALPFPDRSFDVVLIAFVLHHVPRRHHDAILAEARRVARSRLVVLEDTYRTRTGRAYTHVVDSVMNLEFMGHPHANRRSASWLEALAKHDLVPSLVWERTERWAGIPLRHALLVGDVGRHESPP